MEKYSFRKKEALQVNLVQQSLFQFRPTSGIIDVEGALQKQMILKFQVKRITIYDDTNGQEERKQSLFEYDEKGNLLEFHLYSPKWRIR